MNAKMILSIVMTTLMGAPALAAQYTLEEAHTMVSILSAVDDGTVTYRSTESKDQTLKPLNRSENRFLVMGNAQIIAIHGNHFSNDEVLNPQNVFVKTTEGITVSLATLAKSPEGPFRPSNLNGALNCKVSVAGGESLEFSGEFQKIEPSVKTKGPLTVKYYSTPFEQATISVSLMGKFYTAFGGDIDRETNKLKLESDGVALDCAVTY